MMSLQSCIYDYDSFRAIDMTNEIKTTLCTWPLNVNSKYYALCEGAEHDLLLLDQLHISMNLAVPFTQPLPHIHILFDTHVG